MDADYFAQPLDLFGAVEPWGLVHLVVPLSLMFIWNGRTVKGTALVIVAFFFWEMLEFAALIIFKGNYAIFLGEHGGVETVENALLSDPFQGFVGVILYHWLVYTLPRWRTPSLATQRSVPIKLALSLGVMAPWYFVDWFSPGSPAVRWGILWAITALVLQITWISWDHDLAFLLGMLCPSLMVFTFPHISTYTNCWIGTGVAALISYTISKLDAAI